jgi:hypothetical protein
MAATKIESPLFRLPVIATLFVNFRRRRMARFAALFGLTASSRVIDIGGSVFNWSLLGVRPRVLVVNNDSDSATRGQSSEPDIEKICADGRDLPYPDGSFDVAFSNSVIEHVGGWDDQVAFAHETARVAKRYFVQVPNRYFVMEPHFIAPFLQLLPRRLAVFYAQYLTPWGWYWRPTREEAERAVAEIRLLTFNEMRQLFPDAELIRERFLGMTKSIIAVRR